MNTVERIKQQISGNNVLLYMKGTPQFPMCGFSATVVHILEELKTSYAYVNVLDNPDIRSELPKYANWPTFPQLYVKEELVGGCDIVKELHAKSELQPMLEQAGALGQGQIQAA